MGCVDRCKRTISERNWPAEEENKDEKTRQAGPAGYCMHCQRPAECRHCAAGKGRYG